MQATTRKEPAGHELGKPRPQQGGWGSCRMEALGGPKASPCSWGPSDHKTAERIKTKQPEWSSHPPAYSRRPFSPCRCGENLCQDTRQASGHQAQTTSGSHAAHISTLPTSFTRHCINLSFGKCFQFWWQVSPSAKCSIGRRESEGSSSHRSKQSSPTYMRLLRACAAGQRPLRT